jgi:peptidoglycan/LPS O-acetylase OafA/YrhL
MKSIGHQNGIYRPDIDGLRGIAVSAVVIFHAARNLLPSGYFGVDIFFVISGYLIGGIVYRDSLARRFSFAQFYARRAKRILPALYLRPRSYWNLQAKPYWPCSARLISII